MTGLQTQAPALADGRKHQDALHPREALPDADPRASTERKVRKLRSSFGDFRPPAFGIEFFGLRKPPRIAMHHPRTHEEDRPGGDEVIANGIVLLGPASNSPRRRIQPQRLRE